jgi:hypothetical protein
LCEVRPTVWRRLLVPGEVRLPKLHRIFQAAMGWEDCHLHAFAIGGTRYGTQFDDDDDDDDFSADELDEKAVTVTAAIGDTARFVYEYDFGDSWEHEIVVEHQCRLPIRLKSAVCLDGANRCPPEDCGGARGYELLLRVLGDPSHEQYEELREWIGGPLDATEFDLALTNAELQAVS